MIIIFPMCFEKHKQCWNKSYPFPGKAHNNIPNIKAHPDKRKEKVKLCVFFRYLLALLFGSPTNCAYLQRNLDPELRYVTYTSFKVIVRKLGLQNGMVVILKCTATISCDFENRQNKDFS